MEFDMGEIDEEELPFMIIDKDSGRVYDTRNDVHVERLSNPRGASFGKSMDESTNSISSKSIRSSAWSEWWRNKKKSDQDYMWAAECGDLEKLKKFLDKDKMQDMVADVNA